jgi:mannose-6-phosphate isomerase class I
MTLYPLTFRPLLKKIIWGGSDICPFKGITPVENGVGESWELSHVEDNFSIVANGPLAGKSLDELINTYGDQLVGAKVRERFGHRFPLLVKFIDARDNLSIQVHPNDELAKKRHNSFGKTEMWYVIHTNGDAALYSGFNRPVDADEYVKRVADDTFMEILKRYEVKPGDVFLPSAQAASSPRFSRPATSPIASTTTSERMLPATNVNCIRNWPRMPSIIPIIPTVVRITFPKTTSLSTWLTAPISRPI